MWGVLIALATALVLLALPIGRALRSALLTWRFNR